MGCVYSLVCPECRESADIGQDGWVFTANPDYVAVMVEFLARHEGHGIEYASEHRIADLIQLGKPWWHLSCKDGKFCREDYGLYKTITEPIEPTYRHHEQHKEEK